MPMTKVWLSAAKTSTVVAARPADGAAPDEVPDVGDERHRRAPGERGSHGVT